MNKMDKKMLKVVYNNVETKEFIEGTTFLEISESFKKNYDYDILVAKVDNDIVDLSNIQNQSIDFNLADYSITDSINEILYRLKKLISDQGLNIEFLYSENIIINADEEQITKVIYNFISNAMKYVGEDKMIIVKQEVVDSFVLISVIDHGKGIEKRRIDR